MHKNRIKHKLDLFVFFICICLFLLATLIDGFSFLRKNATLVTIKAPQKRAQMEGKWKA